MRKKQTILYIFLTVAFITVLPTYSFSAENQSISQKIKAFIDRFKSKTASLSKTPQTTDENTGTDVEIEEYVDDYELVTVNLTSKGKLKGLLISETDDVLELDMGFGVVEVSKAEVESIDRLDKKQKKKAKKEWKEHKTQVAKNKIKSEAEHRVKFHRKSESCILIPAKVNNKIGGMFILDTGASHVLISPSIALKAGIDKDAGAKGKVVGVGGATFDARIIILSSLKVGQMEATNVKAVVIDNWSDNMEDGLIGMEFLQRFDIQIDSVTNELVFKKRY